MATTAESRSFRLRLPPDFLLPNPPKALRFQPHGHTINRTVSIHTRFGQRRQNFFSRHTDHLATVPNKYAALPFTLSPVHLQQLDLFPGQTIPSHLAADQLPLRICTKTPQIRPIKSSSQLMHRPPRPAPSEIAQGKSGTLPISGKGYRKAE